MVFAPTWVASAMTAEKLANCAVVISIWSALLNPEIFSVPKPSAVALTLRPALARLKVVSSTTVIEEPFATVGCEEGITTSSLPLPMSSVSSSPRSMVSLPLPTLIVSEEEPLASMVSLPFPAVILLSDPPVIVTVSLPLPTVIKSWVPPFTVTLLVPLPTLIVSCVPPLTVTVLLPLATLTVVSVPALIVSVAMLRCLFPPGVGAACWLAAGDLERARNYSRSATVRSPGNRSIVHGERPFSVRSLAPPGMLRKVSAMVRFRTLTPSHPGLNVPSPVSILLTPHPTPSLAAHSKTGKLILKQKFGR